MLFFVQEHSNFCYGRFNVKEYRGTSSCIFLLGTKFVWRFDEEKYVLI
jgi:hypothetical protein